MKYNLTNYEIYQIMEIAHEISVQGFNEGWSHAHYCINNHDEHDEKMRNEAKEKGAEQIHKLKLLLMNL